MDSATLVWHHHQVEQGLLASSFSCHLEKSYWSLWTIIAMSFGAMMVSVMERKWSLKFWQQALQESQLCRFRIWKHWQLFIKSVSFLSEGLPFKRI